MAPTNGPAKSSMIPPRMENLPMAQAGADEIKLVSHSNVVYWWPSWVVGYLMAFITYVQGRAVTIEPGLVAYIHPSNNPGLLFIGTLLLLIIFTNAKLRGIYSVVTIISTAFLIVLIAWLGWWDDILAFIPYLSARAGMGFYLLFATASLVIWLAAFLVFDRLTYWRVRPGQIIEQNLVGGGEHSYDTNGLVFERRDQDLFRHLVLGIGAGDLLLTSSGARKETIHIPNVLFVDSKLKAIQQLISVKPDHIPAAVAAA